MIPTRQGYFKVNTENKTKPLKEQTQIYAN